MLQCEDCEYFFKDPETNQIMLKCNPFGNIKEEACLAKWQLARLDALLQSYQVILRSYQKFAPMQEKMFDMIKREMDDVDQAESWKNNYDEDENNLDLDETSY